MTTPKIETVEINGKRHYKHPTKPALKAPSVTSIIDMLPAPYLRQWNAKVTAQSAVEEIDYINELLSKGHSGKAVEFLKAAPERELNKAADVGTRVHEILEDLIKDPHIEVEEELLPFVQHFWTFCERFEPEWIHVERPVFSVTHMYAGSFDAIARINNKNVILDFKTTRSGISPKVAMQLAAYARADFIWDGEEIEIPQIDAGAALWLRPDKWNFQPLRIDDDIFHTFLSLRRIFEWENRLSKTAMLAPALHRELYE